MIMRFSGMLRENDNTVQGKKQGRKKTHCKIKRLKNDNPSAAQTHLR
jgi:hypothetical protein